MKKIWVELTCLWKTEVFIGFIIINYQGNKYMQLKETILLVCISLYLAACHNKGPISDNIINQANQPIDSTEMTNNFYDNTETFPLPVKELTVEGEVSNPGPVNFLELPKRSVIVKETLLDIDGKDRFTGAFRYDGYSLFDILEKRVPRKLNSHEFSPIIDLYVEIENSNGEKVVFSWGEIYYPNNLHKIIIAKSVSRIVPSKTKELWQLPVESKVVSAVDLITERNISSPVRIKVISFPQSFEAKKGMSPMFSKEIVIHVNKQRVDLITDFPENCNELTYNTIFYGRGRGIHSTEPFRGLLLKDLIADKFQITREKLRKGIMCVAAEDGYRVALSFSEVFNRNDQQEFLIVKTASGEEGGLFRLFPSADFFSDRAVKSVREINLLF